MATTVAITTSAAIKAIFELFTMMMMMKEPKGCLQLVARVSNNSQEWLEPESVSNCFLCEEDRGNPFVASCRFAISVRLTVGIVWGTARAVA